MGPCPTTSTVCPAPMPALRTAFRQVLTGSTNTASSGSTPSGTGIVPRSTIQSMACTYSAMPAPRGLEPGRGPVLLVEGAVGVGAARAVEAGAAGHVVVHHHPLALAEPRDSRAQAGPPCPRSRGRRRAGADSRPFSIFLMSVPQTPQASTRTSISPAAGSGTGSSSIRRSSLPR